MYGPPGEATINPTASSERGGREALSRGAPLRRILVAVDFSNGSRRGWLRAIKLPLAPGATIHVQHVLPVQDLRARRIDSLLLEFSQREFLKIVTAMEAALQAAGRADVTVTTEIAHGKTFVEIVRGARAIGAELVVIGRIGRQRWRRFVLGSNTVQVLRSSSVPVLVAHAARPRPYRRVIAAIDESDAARRAFRVALRLLSLEARRLDVVRALDLSHLITLHELGGSDRRVRREAQADRRRVQRELGRFLRTLDTRGLKAGLVLRGGSPQDIILEEMKSRSPDLVVLGTHGRSGIQHALLGSVAEVVVRRAACDVLVARAPRFAYRAP